MPISESEYYLLKKEMRDSRIDGTIIDIETTGDFQKSPDPGDMQDYLVRYEKIKITAVGTLNKNSIMVFVAKGRQSLSRFQEKAIRIMSSAGHPLYAFNKSFEEGCYYWNSGKRMLNIEHDIQKFQFEKKENVVVELGLHQHNDPFHGDGSLCKRAFELGKLHDVIAHNRACLLKEYYIFRKRGAREFKTTWLDQGKL